MERYRVTLLSDVKKNGIRLIETNDINEDATQNMIHNLFICEICEAYCGGQRTIVVSRHTWHPGWDPVLLLKRSKYARGFVSNDNAVLLDLFDFSHQLGYQYTISHFLSG